MLTLKELDDRSYEDILDNAKKIIPSIFPEWTDLRAHDPGITFIELFAWLTEMLEYYVNRITIKNRLKFLELLNVVPKKPNRAATYITLENILVNGVLPEGTPVYAGDITYETNEVLQFNQLQIKSIAVRERKKIYEVFKLGQKVKSDFFAFGEKLTIQNALYIGIDGEYQIQSVLAIKIDINQSMWQRNNIELDDKFIPLVKLRWEYLQDGESDLWQELRLIEDKTYGLTFSGIIKFEMPNWKKKSSIKENQNEELYYIRCVLVDKGYEISPCISNLALNTVKAKHGNTLSKVYYFSGTDESEFSIELEGYLPLFGQCEVKVKGKDGYWYMFDEIGAALRTEASGIYRIEKDYKAMKTKIVFETSRNVKIPLKGRKNIMVTAYSSSFEKNRLIEFQSVLPNGVFRLDWAINEEEIFSKSFKLQIGNRLPGEEYYKWVDYESVDDLMYSKGNDRHFVLDYKNRELHFGNNENGIMPGGSGENILVITECSLGFGVKGNIKEDKIHNIGKPFNEKFIISNYCSAGGGYDGQSVEEALKEFLFDMKKQYRAVTVEDYEAAALSTPGLMVARAKALPQFVKGQKSYPEVRTAAQISVVVIPYGREAAPMPSKAFINKVKQQLDKLRLITTEVHVIPPQYIQIKVKCIVVILPHIKFDERKIITLLKEYLSPIGGKQFPGWKFGGTVRKGDIISIISSIEGVEYVSDMQLYANGEDTKLDKSGDIGIPPYSLVCSDEHEVQIVNEE